MHIGPRLDELLVPGASSACDRCGFAPADDRHMIWTCPQLFDYDGPAIIATQELRKQVDTPELECLYYRGTVPGAAMKGSVPPPDHTRLFLVGMVPIGRWPGGTYCTDAAGGKYTSS